MKTFSGVWLKAASVVLWTCVCAERELQPEKVLIEKILKNYSPLARPVRDPGLPVNVSIGFALTEVSRVSDTDQSMDCHGIVKMVWWDPFLAWNSTEFHGIESIYLPKDLIWIPDVVTLNSFDSMQNPVQTERVSVKVWSNGSVTWFPSGHFVVSCSMDITSFPFDDQTCSVTLGTSSYEREAINFQLKKEPRWAYRDTLEKIRGNSQWQVLKEEIEILTTNHGERQVIIVTAYLARESRYFVVNVIFPSFALAALNVFVLLVPHELSDKIGVSTTMFLAYVIFLLQISNSMPGNSDTVPYVSVVLLILMSVSAVDVIVNTILLIFARRVPKGPVPGWVLKLLILKNKEKHTSPTACPVEPRETDAYGNQNGGSVRESWKPGQNQVEAWRKQQESVLGRIKILIVVFQVVVTVVMFSSLPIMFLRR